jgi:hypothetical protein
VPFNALPALTPVEQATREIIVVTPPERILVVLGVTGFGHCSACAKIPEASAVLELVAILDVIFDDELAAATELLANHKELMDAGAKG